MFPEDFHWELHQHSVMRNAGGRLVIHEAIKYLGLTAYAGVFMGYGYPVGQVTPDMVADKLERMIDV